MAYHYHPLRVCLILLPLLSIAKVDAECNYASPISVSPDQSTITVTSQDSAEVPIYVSVNRGSADVTVNVEWDGGNAEASLVPSSEQECANKYLHLVDASDFPPGSSHDYVFRVKENIFPFEDDSTTVELFITGIDTTVAVLVALSILFFVVLVGFISFLIICCWKRNFDAKIEKQSEVDTEISSTGDSVFTVSSSNSVLP